MKEKNGAIDYLECNADSHYNVKEVIETAIEVAIQRKLVNSSNGKKNEKKSKKIKDLFHTRRINQLHLIYDII